MEWDFVECQIARIAVRSFHFDTSVRSAGAEGKVFTRVIDVNGDATRPIDVGELRGPPILLRIRGNCCVPVEMPHQSVLHIYGSLNSTVTTLGSAELIVGGAVSKSSNVILGGRTSMYVGEEFAGRLKNHSSCHGFVAGECSGLIEADGDIIYLEVGQDWNGVMRLRTDEPGVFNLVITGEMQTAHIESIASLGFVHFAASIGMSDCSPGIYRRSRPSAYWVVHRSTTNSAGPFTTG